MGLLSRTFLLLFAHTASSTEPMLSGSCITDPTASLLTVFCNTSLDATKVPLEYTCSYDSGPEESCTLYEQLGSNSACALYQFCCWQVNRILRSTPTVSDQDLILCRLPSAHYLVKCLDLFPSYSSIYVSQGCQIRLIADSKISLLFQLHQCLTASQYWMPD